MGELLVRLDTLREIGRDRDDRDHLDLIVKLAGLLRRGIGDTEHAGIVKNVLHLDTLGPVIEHYECHGAATDRSRTQRADQQEAERRDEYHSQIDRLAEPDAHIFPEHDPDDMQEVTQLSHHRFPFCANELA